MDSRVCDNCGRWVDQLETLYHMEVSLMAEPTVKLEMPEGFDFAAEMKALAARMEAMDDKQVSEAADQVFERYRYLLCPECRAGIHIRLKRRQSIIG